MSWEHIERKYLCRKNILIYYFEIEISHYELDKSDKHMIKIIWFNYNINDDTVSHYRYSRTIDFFFTDIKYE